MQEYSRRFTREYKPELQRELGLTESTVWTIFTYLYTLDTHDHCWDSDFVQLFNFVFHYGLKSWVWRLCRPLHSLEILLVESVQGLISFNNWWKGLQSQLWPCFYAVLLFFVKALTFFQLVVYNRFEHHVTRWKVSDCCHIAYLIYVSNAECWQNLPKLTNQRVFQILVHQNDLLLSLPTGVLSLPLATLSFIFSCAVFCAARGLTECQEEVSSQDFLQLYMYFMDQLYPTIERWQCISWTSNRWTSCSYHHGMCYHTL